MNTLYDRLETEILVGLLDNEKNYAAGTKAIVIALKDNYSWLTSNGRRRSGPSCSIQFFIRYTQQA